jgi:hypothetical protein
MMHPEMMLLLARDRQAQLLEAAGGSGRHRPPRVPREKPVRPEEDLHVTIRLDRVGDLPLLHQLAALSSRVLPAEPLVTAWVEGRLVAALPVSGRTSLVDPFAATAEILPLLELRAAQIRGVETRPARRLRLLPRRAS